MEKTVSADIDYDSLSTSTPSSNLGPIYKRDESSFKVKQSYKIEKYQLKKKDLNLSRCGNKNCNKRKEPGQSWLKLQFASQNFEQYCPSCTESIRMKWFCLVCNSIYTDSEHSRGIDKHDWIECTRCARWTHIDCDQKLDPNDLDCIEQENYQYFCMCCKEEDSSIVTTPKLSTKHHRIKHKNFKAKKKCVEHVKDYLQNQNRLTNQYKFSSAFNTPSLYPFSDNYSSISSLFRSGKAFSYFRGEIIGFEGR